VQAITVGFISLQDGMESHPNCAISPFFSLCHASTRSHLSRASPRPLFRDDPIPLHRDSLHCRCLRLPRVGDDQAIGTAASRRGRDSGFPILWHLPAVVGDQPCADRQAAVVEAESEKQRPLQVPGVREGRGLAYPRAELAAVVLQAFGARLR
jgi:hypothetical protein